MLFNSMFFVWCFLPICIIGYYLLDARYRNFFLVCCSLIFYAWGEPTHILILVLSIVLNYLFGIGINKIQKHKKSIMICGIIFNLGMLFIYKYLSFALSIINPVFESDINIVNIALPIGISFYTFQTISYLVDIYNTPNIACTNIMDTALYISFFPKLTAGPIVKYSDMHQQLTERKISIDSFAYGIKRFVYGMAKKVIIAGTLASVVDRVFSQELATMGTGVAWLGAIMYTLQIYFDFSGYSDMAIGLAKLFGFDFKENFDYPYLATSIQDFWRRWHISLSAWFRNYVYFPLGGNRKGKIKTYRNIGIVFLLTGIWHGANYTFIIWGILHGILNMFERTSIGKRFINCEKVKWLQSIYTLFFVTVGWVVFRSDNLANAGTYLGRMFVFEKAQFGYGLRNYMDLEVVLILILSILLCGFIQTIIPKFKVRVVGNETIDIVDVVVIMGIFIISIVYLANNAYSPFIYFKF